MTVSVSQQINAPQQTVWEVIADIENCMDHITGIKEVTVIERPQQGLVGLKWSETREMFGKDAVETMWISEAEEPNWYVATAHNHGTVYTSRLELTESNDGTLLTMNFVSTPQTIGARIMSFMGYLFAGKLRKILAQDLEDIRVAAEAKASQ